MPVDFFVSGKRLPAAGRAQIRNKLYNKSVIQKVWEVGRLKTVLLIMRRASLAQGLMAKVRDAPGIQLCYEPDYANADVDRKSVV